MQPKFVFTCLEPGIEMIIEEDVEQLMFKDGIRGIFSIQNCLVTFL